MGPFIMLQGWETKDIIYFFRSLKPPKKMSSYLIFICFHMFLSPSFHHRSSLKNDLFTPSGTSEMGSKAPSILTSLRTDVSIAVPAWRKPRFSWKDEDISNICLCQHIISYVYIYIYIYVYISIFMRYILIWVYRRLYVILHVCVCMYVCMYVYIYTHIQK